MILALDMASKTGWALIRDGKVLESGVQDFTKRRGESNGLMFLRFRRWLHGLISEVGHKAERPDQFVQLIAYEQAHFRGASTEILLGLQTRAQEMAAEFGIESAPVHTSTLKKWACGSGRADKEKMKERAKESLGREPLDDNEADAVCVGLWAQNEFYA